MSYLEEALNTERVVYSEETIRRMKRAIETLK